MNALTPPPPTPTPWAVAIVTATTLLNPIPTPAAPTSPIPVIERFESYSQMDGIPAAKVHAVFKTTSKELWLGTWNGLCQRLPNGTFKRFGTEDGLSHKMVTTIAEHKNTGDLWIGTMRGLSRYSAGRITSFTQTDSGLPNNVVYGVDIVDNTLWVATAAGAGSLDLLTGQWKIYDHNNAPMHEPWCYAVKMTPSTVFIGVWGGGILEQDLNSGRFKEYRDPDRDFHYDLFPDDGPINDITSWLDWEDGILWQCTYFGFSRYDGKQWKTWVEDKSPLRSNFTQFVVAKNHVAWIGTDNGVSVTDGLNWINYYTDENQQGWREFHSPNQPALKQKTDTALCNNFVLGLHVDDSEVWFATSLGLSRGIISRPNPEQNPLASHVAH
ncbi:MAG: ligand-binding sensor domain-containing protein [Limisphaerales bacterium]